MNLPPTWQEFSAEVDSLLEADAGRLGAETFITKQKRQAVIQLQHNVERFTQRHEQVYLPDNFTTHQNASLGSLPFDAKYLDAIYVRYNSGGACHNHPVHVVSWDDRINLIGAKACLDGVGAQVAIDRSTGTFLVFPKVQAEDEGEYANKFMLYWSGVRFQWTDDDTVPFNERCAQAVADYVKAKIYLHVEKRPDMYREHMAQFNSACGDLYIR